MHNVREECRIINIQITRWSLAGCVCVWVGNGFWLGLLSWDLGRHSCFFPGTITSSISRVELILCAVSSACFRVFSFFFYLLSHAIKKAKGDILAPSA